MVSLTRNERRIDVYLYLIFFFFLAQNHIQKANMRQKRAIKIGIRAKQNNRIGISNRMKCGKRKKKEHIESNAKAMKQLNKKRRRKKYQTLEKTRNKLDTKTILIKYSFVKFYMVKFSVSDAVVSLLPSALCAMVLDTSKILSSIRYISIVFLSMAFFLGISLFSI